MAFTKVKPDQALKLGLLQGKNGQTGEQGVRGPEGPSGRDGSDGMPGVSIQGERGERGMDGRDGVDGKDAIGTDGEQGEKGEVGPQPKHQWRGTSVRFEKGPEDWGKFVDLRGRDGLNSRNTIGGGGSSGGGGNGGGEAMSLTSGDKLRSIFVRLTPGTTPGTNITCRTFVTSRQYNASIIANVTDLGKNETDGAWFLNSAGTQLRVTFPETVVGVIGTYIKVHDLNNSSTTEMYTADISVQSGTMALTVTKRGTFSSVDLTTILQAGDQLDLQCAYVTDS